MNVDALLLDLDGVIFTGDVAVPFAVEAINQIRAMGYPCVFVTNNASRSPAEIAAHVSAFGLPTNAPDVVTSPDVAVSMIGVPVGSAVLVIGSSWLAQSVADAGYRVVHSADDAPAAVIQGFAPTVGWRDLAEACFALHAGARWIATNPDVTLPLERGLAPGNGSLVAAVANAVGRLPDAVAGKPEPDLFIAAAARVGAEHPLVVGDRLDTDIAGGQRAGMRTALVLTGVTQSADHFDPAPDAVLTDLRDLIALLEQ